MNTGITWLTDVAEVLHTYNDDDLRDLDRLVGSIIWERRRVGIQSALGCSHIWQVQTLFTSSYQKCLKCGVEQ